MLLYIQHGSTFFLDASEAAQARLKGLDQTSPVVKVPPKDVNTFKNNQVKFAAGAGTLPPDQIKCNILKAKRDEEMKKANEGIQTCWTIIAFYNITNINSGSCLVRNELRLKSF